MTRASKQGLLVSLFTAGLVVAGVYLIHEADESGAGPRAVPPAGEEPASPSLEGRAAVRDRLLHASAQQLGLTSVHGVWGVLMERGYAKGVAMAVALTDGTASMYISTGGAVTGGRAYAPARAAAQKLCEQAADTQAALEPTKDFPAPAKGRVRFYVLSDGGVRTAERDIVLPGHDAGADPLAPLVAAGDALLDGLRDATSKGYIR